MLTAFSDGTINDVARKVMLGATGGVISVFIIAMAIYMIACGTKQLKQFNLEVENGE